MPIYEKPEELFAASDAPALDTTVCVIGSGFAGAIVAVELARAGVGVIVVESGSGAPDHRLEPMLDTVDVGGSTELKFGFARQFGGASNLWAGRIAPLEPIDFEARDWIAHSGWPIAAADIDSYYARAGEILGMPGYGVIREHRIACPEFIPSENIETKPFQWAARPFNAGHYLAEFARSNDRLRVLLRAPVVALHENESARCVEHATVAQPSGRTARIGARHFVIAAGGIETPRLLLNSTSVRANGIGNDNDVVGRYLSTHPKANMATLFVHKAVSTRHALFSDTKIAGGSMRYGIGFSAAAQKQFQLLNHYAQVLPFLEHRANRAFEALRHADAFNSPLIDRTPLIRGFVPGLGHMVFDKLGRLGGIQRRARQFVLRAYLDQYPNPGNRVTLAHSKNENGMPRANIRWSFSDDDRTSVLDFFAQLQAEVRATAIGRLEYEKLRVTKDWPLIGLHSHFMGTTRMGTDRHTSVVNRDCQVHGSDNVFVAGPSLFPTYGYANPVHTIAALALRLAESIARLVK